VKNCIEHTPSGGKIGINFSETPIYTMINIHDNGGGIDPEDLPRIIDVYALDETKLAIFRRRQIGLIYQFYNLIPVLTVQENITLPLLLDERKSIKGSLMKSSAPSVWVID